MQNEESVSVSEVVSLDQNPGPKNDSVSDDFTVIAIDRESMAASQKQLSDWCNAKMIETADVLAQFEDNLTVAKKNRWRRNGLETAVRRERQRLNFYDKVGKALKAGYVIIPNFEASIFAIRHSGKIPRTTANSARGFQDAINNLPQHSAQALPSGEGDNVSPNPVGRYDGAFESEGKNHTVVATSGFAEIDFSF